MSKRLFLLCFAFLRPDSRSARPRRKHGNGPMSILSVNVIRRAVDCPLILPSSARTVHLRNRAFRRSIWQRRRLSLSTIRFFLSGAATFYRRQRWRSAGRHRFPAGGRRTPLRPGNKSAPYPFLVRYRWQRLPHSLHLSAGSGTGRHSDKRNHHHGWSRWITLWHLRHRRIEFAAVARNTLSHRARWERISGPRQCH